MKRTVNAYACACAGKEVHVWEMAMLQLQKSGGRVIVQLRCANISFSFVFSHLLSAPLGPSSSLLICFWIQLDCFLQSSQNVCVITIKQNNSLEEL